MIDYYKASTTEETPAGNSTYPKCGVSCFADSFVVAASSVLRMKFSGKNPARFPLLAEKTPKNNPKITNRLLTEVRIHKLLLNSTFENSKAGFRNNWCFQRVFFY